MHSNYKRFIIPFFLCMLPVISYCTLLLLFNLDLPKSDDYGDSLRTLIKITATESLSEKWQILFEQHNEHRTLFNRLVYLGQLQLLDKLNYSQLIYIGNAAPVFMVIIYLHCMANSNRNNWLYAIPLVYLVFQPSAYTSMFWAMAALSNYYVMLWALLCFYFLGKGTLKDLLIASGFACLACFTQVNGLLTLPLGLLFLGVNAFTKKDKLSLQLLLVWLTISAVIALCFFSDYQFRDINKLPINDGETASKFTAITSILAKPHWYFAQLGSPVSFGNTAIATTAGICITLALAWLAAGGIFRQQIVLALYLVFALSSVLMTAISRSYVFDIQFSQSPRYTFYATQAVALIAALSVAKLDSSKYSLHKKIAAIIALCSVIVCIVSYSSNLEKVRNAQFTAIRGMWLWNTRQAGGFLAPMVKNPGEYLRQAKQLGLYEPPPISYLPQEEWGIFAKKK